MREPFGVRARSRDTAAQKRAGTRRRFRRAYVLLILLRGSLVVGLVVAINFDIGFVGSFIAAADRFTPASVVDGICQGSADLSESEPESMMDA